MKCTIPEISWHNRDPVLSVDIQPGSNEDFYRLASGGTDCHVLIWMMKIKANGAVDLDILADLTRHQKAVNVVRWSPSGQYLATGDDDSNIIVWQLKTDNVPLLEGDNNDKESWIIYKILRGHKEDVYDICWSPDGSKLLSGSIDNTAMLWNLSKGHFDCILSDHKGFVQGVSWDPKGQYLATLCSDRICRIFHSSGKPVISRICKGNLPVPEDSPFNKETKYFHDDTFKSYFRRLNFSPDGNFLITPSGTLEKEDGKIGLHATYIFSLDNNEPLAILPSPKQVTIAARCCPLLFELQHGSDPVIKLPYRMIIAVATESDVILYDTQQVTPFAYLQKIHYTRLTDVAWSADGLMLVVSSTDGFCTFITFDRNELGTKYIKEESEPEEESAMDISGIEELDVDNVEKNIDMKPKRPNLLEKWTVRTPKSEKKDSNNRKAEPMDVDENPKQSSQDSCPNDTANSIKNLKRITPIPVRPQESVTIEIKDEEIANKASPDNCLTNSQNGAANTAKKIKRITPIPVRPTEDNILHDMDVKQGVKTSTPNKKCKPNNTLSTKNEEIKPKPNSLLNFIKVSAKRVSQENVERKKPDVEKESISEIIVIEDSNQSENDLDLNLPTEKPILETQSAVESQTFQQISKLNEKENAIERKEMEIAESSTVPVTKPIPKTPRRIPFVTLSSPKSKKKTD